MPIRTLPLSVLILIIVVGSLLRPVHIAHKPMITHDEAVSYIAAAGHQGEYAHIVARRLFPYGRWARASDWKRLLLPEERFCFGTISRDLAQFDIHPPLYFWLLHLWLLVVGVNVWSGAALNIVFDALLALVLFALSKTILRSPTPALLVTAVWALNPRTIIASDQGRQYPLLALFTAALALLIVRYSEQERGLALRQAALLAVVIACGALTHYLFLLPVLASLAFVLRRHLGCDRRRLAQLMLCLLAGYVLFSAVHSGFYTSFSRQRGQAPEFHASEIPARLKLALGNLGAFFVPFAPKTSLRHVPYVGLIAAAALLALVIVGRKALRQAIVRPRFEVVAWFLLATAGGTVALNLAFITPRFAVGPRHLAFAWPFLAFVPPWLLPELTILRKPRLNLVTFVCALLIVIGLATETIQIASATRQGQQWPITSASTPVLVDTARRGHATRIIWQLQDSQPVFVADQPYLLSHEQAWLSRLNAEGGFYASVPVDRQAKERQEKIVQLLNRSAAVEPIEEPLYQFADGFRIIRRGDLQE